MMLNDEETARRIVGLVPERRLIRRVGVRVGAAFGREARSGIEADLAVGIDGGNDAEVERPFAGIGDVGIAPANFWPFFATT